MPSSTGPTEDDGKLWVESNIRTALRLIFFPSPMPSILSSDVNRMLDKAEALFHTELAERELKSLEKLVDQSDCIEDGCGLDAELLRHNLLKRITELKEES